MISIDQIENIVEKLLISSGIDESWAVYLRLIVFLILLTLFSGLAFLVIKKIVIAYLYKIIRKSPIKWDDMLADHNVFNNVAHIITAIFVRILAPTIFSDFEFLLPFIIKIIDVYLLVVGMTVVFALLKVAKFGLSSFPAFKDKPLTSYFQLIRIILYITTGILILSLVLGKSPIYFLGAFGAMTAVLLLVFKDTILGLVASVQMSSNDMVRVGDWVEMPKFNADGDVIAINLNTVKIQNWDKTITTIPTYYFITDSFKNWRGMVQSGGRRIKRCIYINSNSIQFVNPKQREGFKKISLIAEYVTGRQQEIEEFNLKNKVDTSMLINGRRMTNLGVFRKYIESYLKNNPGIKKNMTIMVRQLATEHQGVPLEIYCFTDTTEWLEYESVQADIFDHLFSSASYFGLDIFQQPGGKDISIALESLATQTLANREIVSN